MWVSEGWATASAPEVSVVRSGEAEARSSETWPSAPTKWKRLDAPTVYLLWPVLVKSYAEETVDHRGLER